jgi:hypothetical protein
VGRLVRSGAVGALAGAVGTVAMDAHLLYGAAAGVTYTAARRAG